MDSNGYVLIIGAVANGIVIVLTALSYLKGRSNGVAIGNTHDAVTSVEGKTDTLGTKTDVIQTAVNGRLDAALNQAQEALKKVSVLEAQLAILQPPSPSPIKEGATPDAGHS